MRYKTVPGPVNLVIGKNDSYEVAVREYANIIQKEAQGGWKLLMIQEVPVVKNKGCLAGCAEMLGLGSATETIVFNMLVFCKED